MSLRRFSDVGSFDTYKAAYSAQIEWKSILNQESYDWLELFEKGRNCASVFGASAFLKMCSSPDEFLHPAYNISSSTLVQ
jgi:DUF2075 family protein